MRRWLLILLLAADVLAPRALWAQPPLEDFVARVAQRWAAGDASGLVGMAGSRLVVELGAGGGAVEGRHAAAALRELFSRREHVGVRTNQVTVSGGTPPRGYGELAWTSRERGVRDPERLVVYVGAEFEDGAWRIREIRLIR